MTNRSTWPAIAKLLIAFLVGFSAFQLTSLVTQPTLHERNISEYCVLNIKGCKQKNAVITLSSDKIHPMRETEIRVLWPDLPPSTESLLLSLEGHEMMMGVYQLKLSRVTSKHFTGELLLPFCTSNAMTWKGSIKPVSNAEQIEPIYVSLRMEK
ncbi:hypothetical protein [uncultured Photobacterium sp.]|uniref:hypothetical protein n=1 Tax=uncultured Photobacterium sp. TaxID=173973 RepID=UPI0026275FB3|nr:hypothetical protein [uncultured Photobacterium sp.]